MSPGWWAAIFACVLLTAVCTVLVVTTRRTSARIDAELARLRKELLVQVAAGHREHARALLKSAEDLFVAGHVGTAAMLEMYATDFELRAADKTEAAAELDGLGAPRPR